MFQRLQPASLQKLPRVPRGVRPWLALPRLQQKQVSDQSRVIRLWCHHILTTVSVSGDREQCVMPCWAGTGEYRTYLVTRYGPIATLLVCYKYQHKDKCVLRPFHLGFMYEAWMGPWIKWFTTSNAHHTLARFSASSQWEVRLVLKWLIWTNVKRPSLSRNFSHATSH